MADFPYTQVTGKIKPLFEKISQVGKPDQVDKKWLASIGLTGSNDATLIPMLKFIGFIDQSNKPTERWMKYRVKGSATRVLAEGIKEGYSVLFETYQDAHRRSDTELRAFFVSKSSAGVQAISKTITTFKNLCDMAYFDDVSGEISISQSSQSIKDSSDIPTFIRTNDVGSGVVININIQLTLPATSDESIYENLFSAMKKHLLS